MTTSSMLSSIFLLIVLTVQKAVHAIFLSGTGGTSSNAVLASGALIDFDSTTPGQYTTITFGPVTFSSPSGVPFDIDSDFIGSYNTVGVNSLSNDADFLPGQIRIDFASTVSYFGFNFGASNTLWTMDVFGTSGLLESYQLPETQFSNAGDYFGAQVNGISYVLLTSSSGDYVLLDEFRYEISTASPTASPTAACDAECDGKSDSTPMSLTKLGQCIESCVPDNQVESKEKFGWKCGTCSYP
jgi:hypothetical protein